MNTQLITTPGDTDYVHVKIKVIAGKRYYRYHGVSCSTTTGRMGGTKPYFLNTSIIKKFMFNGIQYGQGAHTFISKFITEAGIVSWKI